MIAVPKEETEARKMRAIFPRKTPAQQNQKFGEIVYLLSRESVSVGFACKGGTKCVACDKEQPGHEEKLYVSVSAYGVEALASSSIGAGGFKFGGLGLQGQPAATSSLSGDNPPFSFGSPTPFSSLDDGLKSETKAKPAVSTSSSGFTFGVASPLGKVESSSLKVDSFSFGSPVSASAVSKPIFEIKATECKTNIYTPMLSESGKTSYPLVLWMQARGPLISIWIRHAVILLPLFKQLWVL